MAFPAGAIPGIDVSHWQGAVDWATVAAGGEQFAFAKASDEASVSDQYFADNWSGMKTAGILRSAYHFYQPSDDSADQVNNFLGCLAAANGGSPLLAPGDLPAALDIEVAGNVATTDLLAGANSWLVAVEAATGKRPIVYTFPYFWQTTLGNPGDLSDYQLWISHLNAASPTVPGGWTDWIFWQFAQQSLPGVPSQVTDLNAFNGSSADLQNLAA